MEFICKVQSIIIITVCPEGIECPLISKEENNVLAFYHMLCISLILEASVHGKIISIILPESF